MQKIVLTLGVFVFFIHAFVMRAEAKMSFLTSFKKTYPQATVIAKCTLCHDKTPALNGYGTDFLNKSLDYKLIEALDSDGDGVNNLDEITAGTFPGDKTSHP